jgi:hypothetical protein
VGDDAVTFGGVTQVLTDVGGPDLLDEGGARGVDRARGDGVGLAAQGRGHGRIMTNRRDPCQVGAPEGVP